MDEFGYLSVLLSIIVGLAITQILQGFRGIVLSRVARTHVLADVGLGGAIAGAQRAELVGDVQPGATCPAGHFSSSRSCSLRP